MLLHKEQARLTSPRHQHLEEQARHLAQHSQQGPLKCAPMVARVELQAEDEVWGQL